MIFQPVATETLDPLNASALNFLSEVGRRLTSLSGDSRETSFLFLSMLIQRFNSALIMDSFCFSGPPTSSDICFQLLVFNPGDLCYLGYKIIIIQALCWWAKKIIIIIIINHNCSQQRHVCAPTTSIAKLYYTVFHES